MIKGMYKADSGMWCDGLCADPLVADSQTYHPQHFALWLGITPDDGVEKALAEGKTTRTIDLKSVEGRDEVHAFLRRASVVITGHGPGVAARLGLDAAACHRVNEDVVHVSLPGFAGDEGATMDAYEPVIMAAAGM